MLFRSDELGLKLNEIFPNRYPAMSMSQRETRAQVRAELIEAQRTGDIVANGELGLKLKEMYPARYRSAAFH